MSSTTKRLLPPAARFSDWIVRPAVAANPKNVSGADAGLFSGVVAAGFAATVNGPRTPVELSS